MFLQPARPPPPPPRKNAALFKLTEHLEKDEHSGGKLGVNWSLLS